MNQKELMFKRKENERRLKHTSARHRNCVRLHPQNTEKHELKKAEKCLELKQQNKHFVTEAEFKNKDIRADIFVLDTGRIIEIETSDYELEERKQKYKNEEVTIIHLEDDDGTTSRKTNL